MKEPENGFLVEYWDNAKFAERIIELLDDKKLREKIAKNNLERAKDYRWDLIAEKTMKVYNDVLK